MAAVDLARLRDQTLADGLDSEVTVNTRALIDKVLARYSSEHTTLRELIQNASDAGASTVTVKFETDPSASIPVPHGSDKAALLTHVIQNHTLKRLTVSNNGQPFNPADWSRLKSIADGNPDETKIGAFGVGFYSVFSDCDEPFVVSGDKTMAFYWKGNTLSTKMGMVPSEQASRSTTFYLDYRQANPASPSYNPSKIPNLPTLCQFLATSLTFVGLQSIELHLDDFKVASFTKKTSEPKQIAVPSGLKPETEGKILRVTNVTRQQSQIDAEWSNAMATAQLPPKRATEVVQAEIKSAGSALKSFFSKFSAPPPQPKVVKQVQVQAPQPNDAENISGDSKGVIFLQVCTVEVESRVTKTFSAEIERATKKPPPRRTRIALLTSPYHDPATSLASGSGNTAELASKIFEQVVPTKSGRIFIGFPTAQTIPFRAHVSAPSLIPTVERENVDMNARYISTWNTELLRVAGLACRISYSLDMAEVRDRLDNEPIQAVIPQVTYICKQYTATVSHPSTVLGEKIVEAFFQCSVQHSIAVLSTNGIKASTYVRLPAETLSFLGDVPMIPQELATEAVDFFRGLHERGLISELSMMDMRKGLESKALSEKDLNEFLKWCSAKLQSSELDPSSVQNLFDVTVANVDVTSEGNSGKIISLTDIKSYVNASRINPALPTPPDTIPFAFSKDVPVKQLQMFGWSELSIVRWLEFLATPPQLKELITSETFAMQVLGAVAKSWDQLDNASKEFTVKLLTPHPIMPTKLGMVRPEESYFPTVKIFDDLPTVKQFPGSKDKFLTALGVRKTVDLAKVFEHMKSQDEGPDVEKVAWKHDNLIRYFASVMSEIPKRDMDRLREWPFLPAEGITGIQFRAQQLYAPNPDLLALGLPQIKLPFEFKTNSKEATLLFNLGLKRFPDAATIASILNRAGNSRDLRLWQLAMKYFLNNYAPNGYGTPVEKSRLADLNLPILITEQSPFPALVAPRQCFTNEKAACLKFPILATSVRPHGDKFGVRHDPDIKECIQRLLKSPPRSKVEAEEVFSYLAARSSELDQQRNLISELSSAKIVPIFRKYYTDAKCAGFEDANRQQSGPSEYRFHHHDPPEMVFVGMDREYTGIIDYVHFNPEATAFLLKVGAKHEPSSVDLASMISKSPSQFLDTLGFARYLDLLRKLSDHSEALWKDKNGLVQSLMASRFLLGYRDIKDDTKKKPIAADEDFDDFEDSHTKREWSLNRHNELVIIDDVRYMHMFRDYIISAPQEEELEGFYAKLGTKKLSELVKRETRLGSVTRDQSYAQQLSKNILERVALFLHEYERDASSKSMRHDTKWLNKNLAVQGVSDISTRYTLPDRNVGVSQTMTALITRPKGQAYTLNVVPRHDLYDVSMELVKLLITRPKQNDVIALERILTEPLGSLQRKGINVERILLRKKHQESIAQKERERVRHEQAEQQREEQNNSMVKKDPKGPPPPYSAAPPKTPEKKAPNMPGAFGSPEGTTPDQTNTTKDDDQSLFRSFKKKLFNNPAPPTNNSTDGPQISRDIQTTKSNIMNAIKECRATGQQNINTPHHIDNPATQLDNGGYCNGQQYENLHRVHSIDFKGQNFELYYGRHHSEPLSAIKVPLSQFITLIHTLTMRVFGVDPKAVNIFLDNKSNTVGFNLGGTLFFNLAWFMELHQGGWDTTEGRTKAMDSWFLTYCHELAHNLVKDHNARHNWYNQQIAIEFSSKFRGVLGELCRDASGRG